MRLDYSIWSAPVAGQELLAFSPQTLPNRADALGNDDIVEGNSSVIAFAKDAKVNINAPKPIKEVQLYDLRGRMLYQLDNVDSESFVTPSLNVSKGIVIVKIKLDHNTMATKKILFE